MTRTLISVDLDVAEIIRNESTTRLHDAASPTIRRLLCTTTRRVYENRMTNGRDDRYPDATHPNARGFGTAFVNSCRIPETTTTTTARRSHAPKPRLFIDFRGLHTNIRLELHDVVGDRKKKPSPIEVGISHDRVFQRVVRDREGNRSCAMTKQ